MTVVPTPGLDPELRWVVHHLARRLDESTEQLVEAMAAGILEIDRFDGDPVLIELMEASVHANVTTINAVLANDIPLEHLQPTTAAIEYARRLAQRRVSSNTLMRAYRIGEYAYNKVWYGFLDELDVPPEQAISVARYLEGVSFAYIDAITEHVFHAYEDERRRWLGAEGNVLSSAVYQLLDGHMTPTAFEGETGYRLDGAHLAAVVWSTDPKAGLTALDAAARALARSLHPGASPIVTAVDRGTVWVWIPLRGGDAAVDSAVVAEAVSLPPGIRVAIGIPGSGAVGFARSHEQSRAAYSVASAGRRGEAVVGFGDRGVAVISVMARDLPSTRAWVGELLGPLAEDTPQAQVLRETLSEYLAVGESHVRTAERMNLHRNTVQYRIGKALHSLPARHDRMDLAVALTVCDYLGPAVLRA